MANETTPLNGSKTHPLTEHAKEVLRELDRDGPIPRSRNNPGVANRLHREALTETVRLPSPFKTHKGRLIEHERITDAGRAAIESVTSRAI